MGMWKKIATDSLLQKAKTLDVGMEAEAPALLKAGG
jgi:hypothetical protein